MEQKPKRKRRTKAEMEAARAAGLEPAKRVRTSKKKTAPAAPKLAPEQSVLVMSCLNKDLGDKITKLANKQGVEIVLLEDRVVTDFLEGRGVSERKTLEEFLNDASNRIQTEKQCVALWTMLTGNAPVEEASNRAFTRTEVTKRTNLSHRKASQVLELLSAFGMVEWVKGDYEFKLKFDSKIRHQTIQTETMAMAKAINTDIARYKCSIFNDENLTDEVKKNLYSSFKKAVLECLEF